MRARLLPPLLLAAAAGCDGSAADVLVVRCQAEHVDRFQQARLGPGDRSHWLQPWRSYLDTWPARRMREAAGFQWSSSDGAGRVDLLAGAGMRRATFQIQWQDVDPANPRRLGSRRAEKRQTMTMLRDRGVRPVILADAYHDLPHRTVTVTLAQAAPEGARQLRLDPGSAAQVVPGRTLVGLGVGHKQQPFIRSVDAAGVATLTRPLAKALPAGSLTVQVVTTLPFPRPVLPDGKPNPAFDEPMNAWLDFLAAIAAEARDILGSEGFDLLIFNGAGSPVLDVNNYFDPPPADPTTPVDLTMERILKETVRWVRDVRNGISGARIVDGFTNSRYAEAGSTEVPGVDAFARSFGVRRERFGAAGPARWLDAAGAPDGQRRPDGTWQPGFVPAYEALFPEVFLTALLERQLVPDLAPFLTSDGAGVVHGRSAAPAGGPPPEVAIVNLSTDLPNDHGLTTAQMRAFTTRAVLRGLAAYVGKGVGSVSFYDGSKETELVAAGEPGGGQTVASLKRFLDAFDGPPLNGPVRSIRLTAVGDCSGARQFEGDGSPAHPPLLDREVVAFFPFQVTESRYVAPVYVMTRDLRTLYPEREFTLTIENVRGASATASAFDPITGAATPVMIVRRGDRRLQLRMALTDSPRLLRLEEP